MSTAVGRLVRTELKPMTHDPLLLTFMSPVVTMLIIGGAFGTAPKPGPARANPSVPAGDCPGRCARSSSRSTTILVVNSRHAAGMLHLGRLGGHDLARGRSSPSSRPQNRVCHVHAACRLAGAGSADRRGDRGQVLR